MSGAEMAREKEKVAAKMREKQAAGAFVLPGAISQGIAIVFDTSTDNRLLADAKKQAEGGSKPTKK